MAQADLVSDEADFLIDGCPLAVTSRGQRGKGALSQASSKGTNSMKEDSTLMTYSFLKGLTLKYHRIRDEDFNI